MGKFKSSPNTVLKFLKKVLSQKIKISKTMPHLIAESVICRKIYIP